MLEFNLTLKLDLRYQKNFITSTELCMKANVKSRERRVMPLKRYTKGSSSALRTNCEPYTNSPISFHRKIHLEHFLSLQLNGEVIRPFSKRKIVQFLVFWTCSWFEAFWKNLKHLLQKKNTHKLHLHKATFFASIRVRSVLYLNGL